MEFRSEAAVRDAGRLQVEGKDYRVSDGDILHIRFNV
jgi:ribosome-binding ATPase YchF (GTP1/OBG family)